MSGPVEQRSAPRAGGSSGRGPADDSLFSRRLHYEIAGEEGRALVGSYAISITLALIWLLFVWFGPRTQPFDLLSPEERPIEVTFDELDMPTPTPAEGTAESTPAPGPTDREPEPRAPEKGAPRPNPAGSRSEASTAGAIRDAFGTRSGAGGGGGISREAVRISAPRPIDVPSVSGPARDVSELGTFVRGRESQLRFCYNEFGLKVNPSLAGSVSVAITITASGSVSGVDVTNRTWSGAGASETESCIRSRVRGWRFPAAEAGGGTYGFSFNFTR